MKKCCLKIMDDLEKKASSFLEIEQCGKSNSAIKTISTICDKCYLELKVMIGKKGKIERWYRRAGGAFNKICD